MSRHLKAEPFDRQLRDAFKVLNKDSTGFVSLSDLRHILTSIGEKLELAEKIWEVDVGSDGRIRYEEFIAKWLRFISLLLQLCPLAIKIQPLFCSQVSFRFVNLM